MGRVCRLHLCYPQCLQQCLACPVPPTTHEWNEEVIHWAACTLADWLVRSCRPSSLFFQNGSDEKIDKCDYIELQSLCTKNETIESEKARYKWEKVFADHIPVKELVSKLLYSAMLMCTFCPYFWGKNKDMHYKWGVLTPYLRSMMCK